MPTPSTGSPRGTSAPSPRPRRMGAHSPRSTSDLPTQSGGVSEILSRKPSDLSHEVKVRRLAYSDLPAVIAIERRSFPTPWSLAMFVLELSKPSGICLAASAGDELLGYVICSRYDQVWHLMNIAVAPERRRAGVAGQLLARLIEEARGVLPFTLEVRVSNHQALAMDDRLRLRSGPRSPTTRRSPCTSASASAPQASAPVITTTTTRTR